MRKISLKTAPVVLSIAFGLVLFACPKPISVEDYLTNPDVIEIIEKGRVILTTDSDGTAGYQKVTGLVAGKYYKIDECTFDGVTTDVTDTKFLTSATSPARTANLTGIGRLSGTTIEGLINEQIYRVKAAAPFTGTVTITPTPAGPAPTISAGTITLPYDSVSLDLPSSFNISTYDIVRCPYPTGATVGVSPSGQTITLEGPDTTNDYVFYDAVIRDFLVLKVIIEPEPVIELEVTITPYSFSAPNQSFIFTPLNYTFTQTQALGGITISVTVDDSPFDSVDGWYYGGDQVSGTNALTGAAIASLLSPPDFTVIGSYEFTFVGVLGGVPYNGTFTITINP